MFLRPCLQFFRILYPLAIITFFILAVVPNYDYLPEVFSLSDKLNHLAAFFVLAALAYGSRYPHPYRFHLYFLAGYALFIEIVQYFLPNRFFSLSDVVADVLGVGLFILIKRQIEKQKGLADV
jgi:VanZ family protein